MKIKSVELMRSIRDKMSQETQEMSWIEERGSLRARSSALESLLKKAIQPSSKTVRIVESVDG